jgi:hypothetical protein
MDDRDKAFVSYDGLHGYTVDTLLHDYFNAGWDAAIKAMKHNHNL